jgi:hypothetical protein
MTIILSTSGITQITANDIIESAALKLGAKESGESLTASEAEDSLNILNSMIDSMSIDGALIFKVQQEALSWAGGNATRTIGSGGDFNTTRPLRIESGTFFRDGDTDYPVEIVRDRATTTDCAASPILRRILKSYTTKRDPRSGRYTPIQSRQQRSRCT